MKNDWSSLNYEQKSQRLMDVQKHDTGHTTMPVCLGCINKFIDDLLTQQRLEIAKRFRKALYSSEPSLEKLLNDLETGAEGGTGSED